MDIEEIFAAVETHHRAVLRAIGYPNGYTDSHHRDLANWLTRDYHRALLKNLTIKEKS